MISSHSYHYLLQCCSFLLFKVIINSTFFSMWTIFILYFSYFCIYIIRFFFIFFLWLWDLFVTRMTWKGHSEKFIWFYLVNFVGFSRVFFCIEMFCTIYLRDPIQIQSGNCLPHIFNSRSYKRWRIKWDWKGHLLLILDALSIMS